MFILLCSSALADFSWDAYPKSLDILSRLISAAERSEVPHIDPNDGHPTACYVRRASYIGECKSSFGTIHLLAINYTRSAPRGSRRPPRGHSFVMFFDDSLKLRATWRVDFDSTKLTLGEGNKLFFGDTLAFDYASLPKPTKLSDEKVACSHVIIDGQLFTIPTWDAPQ